MLWLEDQYFTEHGLLFYLTVGSTIITPNAEPICYLPKSQGTVLSYVHQKIFALKRLTFPSLFLLINVYIGGVNCDKSPLGEIVVSVDQVFQKRQYPHKMAMSK